MARFLFIALLLSACSSTGGDDRALRYAAERLKVPADTLRATSRSELGTTDHEFYLITRERDIVLTVVVPAHGALFDDTAADAFDRVARAEDASRRLGQLGAERVALWFAALGHDLCPTPASDQAHFTHVTPASDGGVSIVYPILDAHAGKACQLDLAPDGALKSARVESSPVAAAHTTSTKWQSDQ